MYGTDMKLNEAFDQVRSLLDAASPAAIAVYRPDGEAVVSPVWFRVNEGMFEVVMALADRKLEHLRADPRCVLLIFETAPPFRGVQVRGRADIVVDTGAAARLAIASRYLGQDRGRQYADTARRPPGVIVRLPLEDARAWDLTASLP